MGETADLLKSLATIDEIECAPVTDADQRNGIAPPWAELKLQMERDGKRMLLWLRRHDGELMIEVLREILHPHAGGSILQKLWSRMDELFAELTEGPKNPELSAEARGLATAIAHMESPYKPDIKIVRRMAAERYEARTQ
jgi:hypothetical protein